MATIVTAILIGICFIGAVRYTRKNGACEHDCSACAGTCHTNEMSLYDRYRKDHPKQERV